jgi:hypothetical protein
VRVNKGPDRGFALVAAACSELLVERGRFSPATAQTHEGQKQCTIARRMGAGVAPGICDDSDVLRDPLREFRLSGSISGNKGFQRDWREPLGVWPAPAGTTKHALDLDHDRWKFARLDRL